MVKKNIQEDVNRREVSIIYTTYPKLELMSYFLKEYFCNIIFICSEKGYVYANELRMLLCIDPRYYLNKLVKVGILEEFSLAVDEIEKLRVVKNLNKMNIVNLTTYRFTLSARTTLQSPEVYNELINNANLKNKKYIEYLNDVYNQKKKEQQDRYLLKYRIAKSKKENLRTGEDWAIINDIERF